MDMVACTTCTPCTSPAPPLHLTCTTPAPQQASHPVLSAPLGHLRSFGGKGYSWNRGNALVRARGHVSDATMGTSSSDKA